MTAGTKHEVVLLFGKEPLDTCFDILCASSEKILQALESVEVFTFSSEEEAEAFRYGICVSRGSGDRDFCEITQAIMKRMKSDYLRLKSLGK